MGAEKIFGGTQKNFFLKFWSDDQKKKVFISNYAQWIRAVCLLSWHNSRSRGYVHSLAGRDEKGSSARNLRLSLGVYFFFCPATRLYSRLGEGGTSSDLGEHGPQMPPMAHGLCCPRYRIRHCYVSFATSFMFLNVQSTFLSKLNKSSQGRESPTISTKFQMFCCSVDS